LQQLVLDSIIRKGKKEYKRENYAGSEKPLPTLIKEKEPLWYRVP
jgi:hypothetical protein